MATRLRTHHPCGMSQAVDNPYDNSIDAGPLRDVITVLLGLVPRCRECGAPLVEAREAYGCVGLVCCSDMMCASHAGDSLVPTSEGLHIGSAVQRLGEWMAGPAEKPSTE